MNYRKATVDDALSIAIVNVYTWRTQYTGLMAEELIQYRIKNLEETYKNVKNKIETGIEYYVVEDKNTVIGFCSFGRSKNERYKNSGELYALYILEGYKSKGIGKALFNIAKKELQQYKYDTMIVNCLKGNPSLGFYIHMGGKVIEDNIIEKNGYKLKEDTLFYNI